MRWARRPHDVVRLASLLLVLPLALVASPMEASVSMAQAGGELVARSDALTTSDADDGGRNPLVTSVTNPDADDVSLTQQPPASLTESGNEPGALPAVVEAGGGSP
jgi:hypothetical protein